MKRKITYAICTAMLLCACEKRPADIKKMEEKQQPMNNQMNNQNPSEPRKEGEHKPTTGGCCETAKPQVPQQTQTVSTPEVKIEKAQ